MEVNDQATGGGTGVIRLAAPVVICANAHDVDWAWCLAVDLRARGAAATVLCEPTAHARAGALLGAGSILIVHSWLAGPGRPGDAEISEARSRGANVVIVRRNHAKLSQDAYLGKSAALALWDDYYQPRSPSSKGPRGGGFANLLEMTLGPGAPLDLPAGFVFISYVGHSGREFVRTVLRPFLARAGLPSWDFRSSERLADDDVLVVRVERLIARSAALLVVSTPDWPSPWTSRELGAALRHARPAMAIRPSGSPRSSHPSLDGIPAHEFGVVEQGQLALAEALEAAGATRLA